MKITNIVLYRHIRLDKNEPFYIGIGDIKRAYNKIYRNTHWKNIVSKTKYEVEIIFNNLTWEEACLKEIEFIKLYGRKDLGLGSLVNMTDGGEGAYGYKHTQEFKDKLSKDRTGIKQSKNIILKRFKNAKGIKQSKEHIDKRCKSRGTWNKSQETKNKMSKSHKGKVISTLTRNKISQKLKGIVFKNERRIKISISNSKPILQYDLQGNFIKEWSSIKEASIYFTNNPKNDNIGACLRGKSLTAFKYKWKYKNN